MNERKRQHFPPDRRTVTIPLNEYRELMSAAARLDYLDRINDLERQLANAKERNDELLLQMYELRERSEKHG